MNIARHFHIVAIMHDRDKLLVTFEAFNPFSRFTTAFSLDHADALSRAFNDDRTITVIFSADLGGPLFSL